MPVTRLIGRLFASTPKKSALPISTAADQPFTADELSCKPCVNDSRGEAKRECPICMELKPSSEIIPIAHIGPVAGDVSSHAMCHTCRDSFDGFACPFCRGKIGGSFLITAELQKFVKDFVGALASGSERGDQQVQARWLELWEEFELTHGNFISDQGVETHEGRPDVVANVAKLIVQEPRFGPLVEKGISKARHGSHDGNVWLCNGAGIFLRLHGLRASGSLAVSPAHGSLIDRAYEAIMHALETNKNYHGANLGCLYMQAISAWLSACRCGNGDTDADAAMVRRCGTAVAKRCVANGQQQEVASHLVESYVRLATEPVWGGWQKDVVLKAVTTVNGAWRA